MMSNSNLNKITYIYELPYTERKEFCNIMDINDKWEELGGCHMKMDRATIFKCSKAPMRNQSSTDELLTSWGEQNHTILELFNILNTMQHYQAMIILKPFVNPKYHKLIKQGATSFSYLVKSETGNNLNNEVGNFIKLDTDNNERKVNNLEPEDLNTLGKINEKIHSDPSVMFSSAEACTPLITYNELKQATNYWNKENILGKGGFGVVFKGIWKNTAVAIKRLEVQKGAEQQFNILEAQRQQSLRELKYLNSCRHDNILSLYGFSIGGEKPCLVYQYMINGSLEDRLQCRQGTEPLTWKFRFKIATGSARGLQFLHGMDKPLIHGDIKSANILLDPNFEPRIGDFGLAREGPLQEYTHVKVSHVHGTRPYLPDEFLRGKKFSTKVDTYSFGVVLFEIATGQRAYNSLRKHIFLKDHVENNDCLTSDMADVKAGPDKNNIYASLMAIGKKCVSHKPKDRPEMEQVLRQLDCAMLQEKESSNRYSCLSTFQNEILIRKLSPPSESHHAQQWIHSPVPSIDLLKQITSGPAMPQIKKNNCLKVTSNPDSTRPSNTSASINKSLSDSNGDSNSTPQFVDPELQTTVEVINIAPNDSTIGEYNDQLPLLSILQIQPNHNSQNSV
ncbi:serine/threonine-protein kinase pelle-like [Metopolophium dirhodum]|uniref:serine/threonine-protein kinase pelle-like n=1 Tax=Metopolophium dirhodum TaxID=44670 RepID=UPI00298FD11C|nr:serine/threonine-protein kinase pelle-like [Metopolophium dirhodum]XP_060876746.1 serine/threonine-protein kinase pelle-like [Metopolophium dirhodum]